MVRNSQGGGMAEDLKPDEIGEFEFVSHGDIHQLPMEKLIELIREEVRNGIQIHEGHYHRF
jgi:hypothetical protein